MHVLFVDSNVKCSAFGCRMFSELVNLQVVNSICSKANHMFFYPQYNDLDKVNSPIRIVSIVAFISVEVDVNFVMDRNRISVFFFLNQVTKIFGPKYANISMLLVDSIHSIH